jgi:hypothetical protein
MRDPHVERLHYKIGTGERFSFASPAAVDFSNHLGQFSLAEGTLVVRMSDHFADEDSARAFIEPFLHAWQIDAELTQDPGAIQFKFLKSDIVDRDPPQGNLSMTLRATGTSRVEVTELVTRQVGQTIYPGAPVSFRFTPEVDVAYRRWLAFRQGREPLQSAAYAILTLFEGLAGGGKHARKHAAKAFGIDTAIFDTIGHLSSEKGDALTARKLKSHMALQQLSGAESAWLDRALRLLIRRLGDHGSGATLQRVTMSDLPKL